MPDSGSIDETSQHAGPRAAERLLLLRLCQDAGSGAAGLVRPDRFRPTRGPAREAFGRHLAFYLAHVCCQMPLRTLARMARRDPASVRHACARIEDRRDDPGLDLALELLAQAVRRSLARLAPLTVGSCRQAIGSGR